MTIHVTHNDLDGAGCAILVKKFIKNVDTYYLNYNDVDTFILNNFHRYRNIIISDVSPNEEIFKHMLYHIDITFIDHHKTSAYMKDYDFTVHDTTKCATLLTYQWLESMGYPVAEYKDFANCINDFDMWHLKRDDSLKMNMLFTIFGIERFVQRYMANPSVEFSDTEKLVLELESVSQNKYIENAAKNVQFFIDNRSRRFGVLFAESYNSELGHYILHNSDCDYIVMINAQKKKISMRSKTHIDVSEIASWNGGGGHKNAAGFSTSFDFNIKEFLFNCGITNAK